jgi:hypothetical protein
MKIRDRNPDNPRAVCIHCGTWVCHECWDWHRNGAARNGHQICIKCGGIEGEFIAVRHNKEGHDVLSAPAPLILHRMFVVGPKGQISLWRPGWR